jgi:hypothetical protein
VEAHDLDHQQQAQGEITPIDMVERDFSMLFDLSLFVILFSILGLMKSRLIQAGIDENTPVENPQVQEEVVSVEFSRTPDGGGFLELDGEKFALDQVDASVVQNLNHRTEGRKVRVTLDAQMETSKWFSLAYALSQKAKSIEFTTK